MLKNVENMQKCSKFNIFRAVAQKNVRPCFSQLLPPSGKFSMDAHGKRYRRLDVKMGDQVFSDNFTSVGLINVIATD